MLPCLGAYVCGVNPWFVENDIDLVGDGDCRARPIDEDGRLVGNTGELRDATPGKAADSIVRNVPQSALHNGLDFFLSERKRSEATA